MALKLSFTDLLSLPNSLVKIPQLGFGVGRFIDSKFGPSALTAMQEQFKDALEQSGLKRSDVFLATRSIRATGSLETTYSRALERIEDLAGKEGYVDLALVPSEGDGPDSRKEMYQTLESLLENGKTRSIGVKNWGIGHLEELKIYAKVFPPHVNQLELHPFCQQRSLVEYCQNIGMVLEANCPQIRNRKDMHPTLMSIAQKHGTSVRQLLLRYSLQKGWVPIPRTDIPKSILANANVYNFELTKGQMETLDRLDEGMKGALSDIPDEFRVRKRHGSLRTGRVMTERNRMIDMKLHSTTESDFEYTRLTITAKERKEVMRDGKELGWGGGTPRFGYLMCI